MEGPVTPTEAFNRRMRRSGASDLGAAAAAAAVDTDHRLDRSKKVHSHRFHSLKKPVVKVKEIKACERPRGEKSRFNLHIR